MTKPVRLKELNLKIQELLNRWFCLMNAQNSTLESHNSY
jgi:hypothetical protein